MTSVDEILASEYPLTLDPDYEGCCPCAKIGVGDNASVRVHCWRVQCESGCKYSGVHVEGLDHETANKVAQHIIANNPWSTMTDWEVHIV